MSPKVSVIIPTYNGAKKISDLLSALEQQTFKDFEVIVVIDGSTDNTEQILRQKQYCFPLRLIVQENKGRAGARNAGAEAANGETLVFLDDDTVPCQDVINRHYERNRKSFRPSIIVGALMLDERVCVSDIQQYRAYLDKIWTESLRAYDEEPLPDDKVYMTAGNFSLLKKTFIGLGGFDERLKDAEDYDLALRAKRSNIPIFYDHSIYAKHNDLVTCRNYVLRRRQYHRAHLFLRGLNPDGSRELKYKTLFGQNSFRRLFYSLISRKIFVSMIDGFNIFQYLLPGSIRYKLYESVIWGLSVYFPERKI